MSGTNQFYADNEKDGDIDYSRLDLSIAHQVKSNAIPEEEWENQKVLFFCHDCDEVVEVEKKKGSVKFSCKKCGGNNISFGTEKSLTNFFKLNSEGKRKTG